MTAEEQFAEIRSILSTLTAAVMAHDRQLEAHDRQIESLITVAEKQNRQIAELTKSSEQLREDMRGLVREWQAYLRTLPRQ